MRLALLVCVLALLGLGMGESDPHPYKVAFDLTSRDSLDQKAVLRWIKEVGSANPDAEMEVVMYGKGFELVMPDRCPYIADVQEAMKTGRVSFKVCAIAMKNNHLEKSQMLPDVQTVPDGIHELVMKQQEDWGYIKVVH